MKSQFVLKGGSLSKGKMQSMDRAFRKALTEKLKENLQEEIDKYKDVPTFVEKHEEDKAKNNKEG